MKNIYGSNKIERYVLNNGVEIPAVAFGTYKAADGKSADVIRAAIGAGYRYFDTASFYGTETYLAEAIRESGIPRREFFIASKLWKDEMGYENVKSAFERTLNNLRTDYLDLYLIHWPLPEPGYKEWRQLDKETWRAMEELYEAGKIRAIGLSNFLPHHIENILKDCRVRPAVDQIEYHPGYSQEAVVNYCRERGILVQAWSPIGRSRVLDEPLVKELAAKYDVSPAQICLKFAVQRNIIPLPKSSSEDRMRENLDLYSFELEQDDIWRLSTMPQTGWSGEHPDRARAVI
ncbi:aldo/keto reductase [Mediterraneibacter glycyrrhizinilyticus]|uniref:aldo/keto reductase n=1 Tax=Mediterraneibacter glycyrrhizinilyticus TaxID=342942 RepID=UPI0019604F4D|nr:aldo/keto reductase [Mediterraneibacter glycyrrhizinilyticus]MBM6803835.1 aldo/keto reductase [Mediterraneibacter glycyrrhizinilyticus]MDM8126519.1 aldo/keto reductase [Mediterraneibacter glycyrrhizinilyticus]